MAILLRMPRFAIMQGVYERAFIMLSFIKTNLTSLSYAIQGIKPTRHRVNQKATFKDGTSYFVGETLGGKSGEGFIVINRGNKVAYFPNYNRNGKTRLNGYVPFKQIFGKMRYQHKTAKANRKLTVKRGKMVLA